MDMNEVKTLIDQQGKAFEAFKGMIDGELKKKANAEDIIAKDKLEKIEKSLDTAIEAKAKIEAAIAAEKNEREELEKKFNRLGITKDGEAGKRELEIKTHNIELAAHNGAKNRPFTPLDESGYDAYKTSHAHYLRKGKDELMPDEIKTLSVGSDPDGGYFVTPDTGGRVVKKVYETSPMRQICAVQTISTDALEGIEDLGEAGAGYAGEQATSGDTTTPQIGKWRIGVFWIDTEPKTTQQLLDDAMVDVEAWLAAKVGDKLGRFENNEFVNGAAAKIRGIASYTTAADDGTGVTWGTIGHVVSGANGDFVAAASFPADKIFDLIGTLKEAYLANARFVTRRQVITKMRKLKDTTGQFLWQPSLVLGNPETFAAYPITRAEDMPALATNSLSLAFGDFQQAYQIVDRSGIRVLRDNLTSKPFVKFYTTKRTGGGVINFEALKFMKFGT
jgi:HK97 family phage major capsid protein